MSHADIFQAKIHICIPSEEKQPHPSIDLRRYVKILRNSHDGLAVKIAYRPSPFSPVIRRNKTGKASCDVENKYHRPNCANIFEQRTRVFKAIEIIDSDES